MNADGDLVLCDTNNHCLRKVTRNGEVTTIAGEPDKDVRWAARGEAEVKVVVEVEDAAAVEAVEEKLGALDGGETDVFGDSFEVTAVAAVVVTAPSPSPPPAEACDCGDADASDDCKATCDIFGAGLLLTGTALILVIALPIGGCCLLLCLVLIVVCICRKKAAADEASSVAKAIALLQRSSVAKAVAGEKDPKKIDVKIRTFV